MDDHALKVLEYEELKSILLAYASSDLAREVVRTLRPSSDPVRLALSLRQLDEARLLSDEGSPLPTRGLGNMLSIIKRARSQGRAIEPSDLLRIRDILVSCRELCRFVEKVRDQAPSLWDLARKIQDHTETVKDIEFVIEVPGRVRDGASPKLFELRNQRTILEEEIREVMVGLAGSPRIRAYLRERTFSVRNGRYVLPVILDKTGYVPGILHDKSASGNTAFVEPQEIAVRVNELEDVRLDENREVSRILNELSRRVFDREPGLTYTQNVVAWLDFTGARAAMSAELGLVAAGMAEGSRINLRDARHPLLVQARAEGRLPHEVVPCSLELGGDHRMLVITGPNTGGKTVVLKTVGLIQLMFQSGLHVPAASGTELPVLAAIHADIGDEQSITQNLSTFSGHIQNIARILTELGPRVLVLLDELGAGTDPAEGAALGESILDDLNAAGALTLVTTHMGSLKTYGFTRPRAENACVTFDTRSLKPTYGLLVGQPGNSNALIIAARYGIPEKIVERARALVDDGERGTEELVDQLVASRVANEETRIKSEAMMVETTEKLNDASRALEEASGARDRVEEEAESEVSRILSEFAAAARPHLNALKNVPKGLQDSVQSLEELARNHLQMTPFAARRREFIRTLKKHDHVYIPRFNRVCRIEKLSRGDERMTVRVGDLSMEVSFDSVSWVTPPSAE